MRFKAINMTNIESFPIVDWYIDQYAWQYVDNYKDNHHCPSEDWAQLIVLQCEEESEKDQI